MYSFESIMNKIINSIPSSYIL